jgi:hypothetical protein
MRRLGVAAACIGAAAVCATPAPAQPGQTEPCPRYDGKYEIPQGWEGSPASGVSVIAAGEEQVTVGIAQGFVLTRFCYKTGVRGGGTTSAESPIVGPATVMISKTNSGGGLSHVTFDVEPWAPPVAQPPVAQPPVVLPAPPVAPPPVALPVPPVVPAPPVTQPAPPAPRVSPKRPVKLTKRKARKKPSRNRPRVRRKKPRVLPFTP